MAKSKVAANTPGKTIDEYIDTLPVDQRRIVSSLIALVRETAPSVSASIKWAQPVFEQNGPFCYVRAFSKHVNLGFWRGADISSGKGILESGGQKMAHVRVSSLGEIKKDLFQSWVREAVSLNLAKGDPTNK